MKTTQPIRKKEDIRKLANYFLELGEIRNHVLVVMSCFTGLRISDLLRLKWEDVYDFKRNRVLTLISLVEKKTKKTKTIALHKKVITALVRFAPGNVEQGKYLFESRKSKKAISRVHAYRLIREAGEVLEFDIRISCHSLRKSFGYRAYKSGHPLAVIMEIYNHSSIKITMRYLGITQDEINKVYRTIKMM